jgi:phosphate transport system permease protein
MERRLIDLVTGKFMFLFMILPCVLVLFIAFALIYKSVPILATQPLSELFFSSLWQPSKGQFGFLPFIAGTIFVTVLAMIISIPLSILMSVYLAEYAPHKIRGIIKPMIDVFAGIPSVVYGLFGVLLIVPLIRYAASLAGITTTGYTVLAGGIVLAIMVFPVVIAISEEVIRAVSHDMKEASMALGATKWQTVRHVILRASLPGIAAAIILGFGRAFGETMAVLMVVGNVPKIPLSLFDPAYPIPALIANNYGEMMSIPLYESALMFAGLLLFVTILVFSIAAEIILTRVKRRYMIG